jgi:hypothetical protein
MTMTKQTYIKFQWEGCLDGDPSGIATFTYKNDEVYVDMNNFQHAMFLHSMIESALEQCRVDTLDSVETNITNLLHKKRYE